MEKKQKMYMLSKEEFNKLKAAWKKLVDARRVTAKDMLVYNLLRDKRGDRGFVEVLNPRRIKASDPMYAFNEAYNSVWNQTRPKETFFFEKTYAKNQEDFEARYGIAQPVGFREAINSSRLP